MTQRWWYQDQKCWHYYSAHCAWLGMPRSLSPRQGDLRYWRQLTVHGANLDQMIFPQQTHYLGKIFSPPSQARWKMTLHSPRQLWSQKEASERRKRPPFLARGKSKGMSVFFRGGPPAKNGGRQGKSFFPYSSHPYQNREGDFSGGRQFTNSHRQGQKPLYHEPKLPPDPNQKTPQRKFWDFSILYHKATWRA